ncbi:acyltransferase [Phenylobacterium sp. J426]|uniref:acyltransferase family protein n=1 Tax=Phenylobacterium sp. J426 TaxID=2898439 RepID=UPI002150BEA5|nr:acyltransferase [Phenylobacterium sp. J426]MCR5875181.1 acyltransferase [Phenylobacterium sp. J426]
MGALRLLLAVSVVLNHAQGFFRVQLAGGVAAVEAFFMISGFVMALVLSTKYDPVADRGVFYSNRLLRIFIPYFAVLAFAGLVGILAYFMRSTGPFALIEANDPDFAALGLLILTQITIVGQELFLFLTMADGSLQWSGAKPDLGVVDMLLIPPVWSISLELMFYAVAPWLVRLRSRWLLALIAASLLLRVAFVSAGLKDDPWSYRFFPLELCFFIGGMVSYRIYAQGLIPERLHRPLGLALLLAVFAFQPAAVFVESLGAPRAVAGWAFYSLALVCLPALFAWTKSNARDAFLGNFSYAVYLVHWPILILIDSVAPGIDGNVRAAVAVLASLAMAFAITELIEKPVDRWRQRRFNRRSASSSAPAAPNPARELPQGG